MATTKKNHTLTIEDQPKNENKELIKVHFIEGTIFQAVQIEESNEWHLCFGRNRLNEHPFKSLEEVEKEAKKITWERILQVIGITIAKIFDQMKENKNVDDRFMIALTLLLSIIVLLMYLSLIKLTI